MSILPRHVVEDIIGRPRVGMSHAPRRGFLRAIHRGIARVALGLRIDVQQARTVSVP